MATFQFPRPHLHDPDLNGVSHSLTAYHVAKLYVVFGPPIRSQLLDLQPLSLSETLIRSTCQPCFTNLLRGTRISADMVHLQIALQREFTLLS